MVLLQPKLHLRLSQRQILTPGLVQMVSVLALNKLELRDMITAEMVENPVLEELEDTVPLLDDAARQEEDRERIKPEENTVTAEEKKDPFEEIDFGSFFQEYLDPGYRSRERDGRDRAAVIREFSLQAHDSLRPSGLAARRIVGASGSTRGR